MGIVIDKTIELALIDLANRYGVSVNEFLDELLSAQYAYLQGEGNGLVPLPNRELTDETEPLEISPELDKLSRRQKDVVLAIVKPGATVESVARTLRINPNNVHNYLRSAYRRLNVSSVEMIKAVFFNNATL